MQGFPWPRWEGNSPQRRLGLPDRTASPAGAFSEVCDPPRGRAQPREGGGAASGGANPSARGSLLSPPARPTHARGHRAAVRGLAMANGRAPAAWGRAEGARRGWRGEGWGGGEGVASQVPLSAERGLLQMSSGPRRRARRVSATYGGWI